MQKLIIKNFAGIEYAEIEIKKILVLIGEQASGKSTIAKLIYFFKSLKNDLFEKIYFGDETLMLSFMQRVSWIKEFFGRYNSIEGLISFKIRNGFDPSIEVDEVRDNLKQVLESIRDKIYRILKGKYKIDSYGEKILINEETQEYVYLNNASSGQQESIRILQDIFLTILHNSKVLRIIEEPEAHLFPIAQKQLIELLSLMVNHNEDNQLIITTHSPYILTVFNNLLFAKRVVEKNPSVEIVFTLDHSHEMDYCVLRSQRQNCYVKTNW